MKLSDYATVIFDCDGVILDSNKVKTDAFSKVAKPFGAEATEALVNYHLANGGVSRYKKFSYFIEEILPLHRSIFKNDSEGELHQKLISEFQNTVLEGLLNCDISEGLHQLRALTPDSRWMVVSGGDQSELRKVFQLRDLDYLFESGIFGSPLDKYMIVNQQFELKNINWPVLFIGDSRLDHEVSAAFCFDFIFVSKWSEFSDWQAYCKSNNITVFNKIADLISVYNKDIAI